MKAWLPLVAALATPAFADRPAPPPPAPPPTLTAVESVPPGLQGKDIRIETPGERSRNNLVLVGGLAAGAAVLLGVGLYYNLDSQSGANAVSENVASGRVWTPGDQSDYDRAHDSAVKAGIFYGIGGGLLIASIVTLVVTDPKPETTIIHPHGAIPTVSPTPGGAMLGGAWSF